MPRAMAESDRQPQTLAVDAHAKLNLHLRVLGREESGYHSIETVFVRLALADWIEIRPSAGPGIRLDVEGRPGAPADETNLCWRAAHAFLDRTGARDGVAIRLVKNIPAGAGLGGGSADAAAVLAALNELHGGPLSRRELVAVAGELGSDVPFGLCEAPCALAWERGRRLLPLDAPPVRHVLMLVPGYPVSAADAYRWLAEDRAEHGEGAPRAAILSRPDVGLEATAGAFEFVNDLEAPVFRRHPDLERARDELLARGATRALLCGSGSCVAGLFESAARRDAAAASLAGPARGSALSTHTLAGRAPRPGLA